MAEVCRKLEKNLSNDRYRHTLSVAYTAAALATCYQASTEDAEPTGLLHDCAKEYDKRESFSIAEKSGIRFSAVDMAVLQVWHVIIGPVVVEKRYDVAKSEILSAIR